jgi:hypothetical protein
MAIIVALSLAVWAMKEQPFLANHRNVTLLHSLCWSADFYVAGDGRLESCSEPADVWQQGVGLNPCQALWSSRLHMPQ